MNKRFLSASLLSLVLCVGGSAAAQASIIAFRPNANVSRAPFRFHLGNSGEVTYGVSYESPYPYNIPSYFAVTGANSDNAFLGNIDTSSPITYAEGTQIPAGVASFASYSDLDAGPVHFALSIDDFTSPAFLALKFELGDGIHYGYAKLIPDEYTLATYAYQSEPGIGIEAGALPQAAVPGPSSLGMLCLGLLLIGFGVVRRHRGSSLAVA